MINRDKIINLLARDYKEHKADELQCLYGDDWTSNELNKAVGEMIDYLSKLNNNDLLAMV